MTCGGKGSDDDTVNLWIVDSEGAEANNPELFTSLHNSLSRDQYIKEKAELTLSAPREVMGLDLQTIQLVLSTGFEVVNLARLVSQWYTEIRPAVEKDGFAGAVAVRANGRKAVLSPEDMSDQDDARFVLRRAFSGAPDPRESSCVLIGVSDYASLPRLPGVLHNITHLRKVLGDPEVWGIPSDRFMEVKYPQSADDILDAIDAAAERTNDTLLVYFAGHGLFYDQEFRLALPEATENGNENTVRWQDVDNKIRESGCSRTVVWLDCCHAGQAATGDEAGTADDPSDSPNLPEQKGAYLLAAVPKSDHAMAPTSSSSGCTAFTHELVEALSRGIEFDRPKEFLSLNEVHQHVRTELTRKGFPEPIRKDRHKIGQRPHFYNKFKIRPSDGKSEAAPRSARNQSTPLLSRDNRWGFPMPKGRRAVAIIGGIGLLVGLIIAYGFVPGSDVGGLDLGKRCAALSPGGTQPFAVAGDGCAQVIELDDACNFTYQTTGMDARFLSQDPRSAQCFTSPSSSASRGGIKDMTGYCASHTGVPGVVATTGNVLYRDKWVCQSNVDLDLECKYQYNRSDLAHRKDENGNLICREDSWF